jgi:hypothetical protein
LVVVPVSVLHLPTVITKPEEEVTLDVTKRGLAAVQLGKVSKRVGRRIRMS